MATLEEEFRAAMPAELKRLQERLADSDDGSRRDAIRERLAAHLPLYRISRYRAPRLPGSPRHRPWGQPTSGCRRATRARTGTTHGAALAG